MRILKKKEKEKIIQERKGTFVHLFRKKGIYLLTCRFSPHHAPLPLLLFARQNLAMSSIAQLETNIVYIFDINTHFLSLFERFLNDNINLNPRGK